MRTPLVDGLKPDPARQRDGSPRREVGEVFMRRMDDFRIRLGEITSEENFSLDGERLIREAVDKLEDELAAPPPDSAPASGETHVTEEVGEDIHGFVKAVLHGDDEHREWLIEAADQWVRGEPVPPARGKGAAPPPDSAPASGETRVTEEMVEAADIAHTNAFLAWQREGCLDSKRLDILRATIEAALTSMQPTPGKERGEGERKKRKKREEEEERRRATGVDRAGVLGEIAAERQRQIDTEGRTLEHDDTHTAGEMVVAGACYALSAAGWKKEALWELWPKSWSITWLKPKNRRRSLIKAGALIVAEIERLDRALQPTAAAKPQSEGDR